MDNGMSVVDGGIGRQRPCRVPLQMGSIAVERHFTIGEVAELWGISRGTVRKLFEDEPGVLRFGHAELFRTGTRQYISLRIPESVLESVHRKRSGVNMAA